MPCSVPLLTHRVVQSRSSSALLRHRDWKKRVTRDITALYLPSRPVASHRNSSVEGISIAILPNTLSEILANPRVGKVCLVNCHCWLVGLLESRTKFMVSSLVALCCHTLRGRRICTDCADCNVCLLALAATDCGKVTAKVILSLYGPWSSTAQHIRRAQIESLQVRKKETRRLRHLMVLMRIFALTLD